MTRLAYVALAVALAVAGLALRLGPWRLPLLLHHFGGGFLWGAMIYALVAALRPPRWGTPSRLAASVVVIVAVEGARLVHAPDLDAFRTTLAGQFLLGRIFSPWNVIVDTLGAATAAGATALAGGRALLPRR